MSADRPELYIVAGPSGAGKSSIFNSSENEHLRYIDRFNIDDRLAQLNNGSYRDIPNELRPQANRELAEFIKAHIGNRRSFSTETTLRHPAMLNVTERAADSGFETRFTYVAAENADIHIKRVQERAIRGGHSAPPEVIRSIYEESTSRVPRVLELAEQGKISSLRIYDNTGREPVLQIRVEEGYVIDVSRQIAPWIDRTLANSKYAVPELQQARGGLLSEIDLEQQQGRRLEPLHQALSLEDAQQFKWAAQTGSIQSYRHPETGKHIHIDSISGQFYNQQRNPISQQAALAHAMPSGHDHALDQGYGYSR